MFHSFSLFPSKDYLTDAEVVRDLLFITLAGMCLGVMYHVESSSTRDNEDREILDMGFQFTLRAHKYLESNPDLNDVLAAINSGFLSLMMLYPLYRTFIRNDFSLAFRMGATLFFRAFCGWFTYLPSPPTFLPSMYDMPEIFHCVLGPMLDLDFGDECSAHGAVLPFVTFFSGHTAMVVMVANDMWRRKWSRLSIFLHVMNAFQMVRLLATRGHYSIDIIIGWVAAIYVSSPAARIGRRFSKIRSFQEVVDLLKRKVSKRPKNLFLPPDEAAPSSPHSPKFQNKKNK